jgi:chromosome partitioning protein
MDHPLTPDPMRQLLTRVIAIANGKGGVGKTSLSTHIAALLAAAGHRVLLVDLDPQGNCGRDLGYIAAGQSDEGAGLTRAVQFPDHERVTILHDVRPGLDVIPGGRHLDDLNSVIGGRQLNHGQSASLALARVLAPVAGDGYSLVVLDCPPRHPVLQTAALAMARWLLIPTKTDLASRDGLGEIAMKFGEARAVNPDLGLLGVVLFGVTPAAKKIRATAIAWITEALDGQAPVLKGTVRHVEAPAFHIRDTGLLAHELELGPEVGATAAMMKAMKGLADDYAVVTTEVLNLLIAGEAVAA